MQTVSKPGWNLQKSTSMRHQDTTPALCYLTGFGKETHWHNSVFIEGWSRTGPGVWFGSSMWAPQSEQRCSPEAARIQHTHKHAHMLVFTRASRHSMHAYRHAQTHTLMSGRTDIAGQVFFANCCYDCVCVICYQGKHWTPEHLLGLQQVCVWCVCDVCMICSPCRSVWSRTHRRGGRDDDV